MFTTKEIKKLLDNIGITCYTDKLVNKKVVKEDILNINLTELNYLLDMTSCTYEYDISKLAQYLKVKSVGYTKIIRELGIPKATLSQMLNNGRNIKLSTLNKIFKKYTIDKELLRREK